LDILEIKNQIILVEGIEMSNEEVKNKHKVFFTIFYRTPCPKTGNMVEMKVLEETDSTITLQCSDCGEIITREVRFFATAMKENPSYRNSSL
jgi:hypothetical protein